MGKRLHYTEEELMRTWCEMRGLESPWQGVESLSQRLLMANVRTGLRAWYSRLLRTAPPERLPVRDLAAKVTKSGPIAHSGFAVHLPQEGYQPVAVQMEGWDEPVRTFYPLLSAAHRRQVSQMRRSRATDPVAVRSGGILLLYGFESEPAEGTRPVQLLMTAWPADGSYEFEAEDFPGPDVIEL